jgi:DNA-binding transcriptional regulator YiaG
VKKSKSTPAQAQLISKRTRTRSHLSLALIELRQRLEETQQSLAHRLNVSLHSVALWETKNTPRGLMLLRLSKLAQDYGHADLAEIFADAVGKANRRVRELLNSEEELWDKIFTRLYRIQLEADKLADAAARDRIISLAKEAEQLAETAQEGSWRNQR